MQNFNDITFRPMLMADLPQIIHIENERVDLHWPEHMFYHAILHHYECVVLEKNNILIGYAVMFFLEKSAHLSNICVTSTEQGKGYGRAIMQHLISIVNNKKISAISLNVLERKTNLYHFYQQFGFQTIKRLPDYYKTSQGIEAALVLELQIEIQARCN